MIWFPNVPKSHAEKAMRLYRQGLTQEQVGMEMGWHRQKAAKILRNYERHGAEIFADDRERAS